MSTASQKERFRFTSWAGVCVIGLLGLGLCIGVGSSHPRTTAPAGGDVVAGDRSGDAATTVEAGKTASPSAVIATFAADSEVASQAIAAPIENTVGGEIPSSVAVDHAVAAPAGKPSTIALAATMISGRPPFGASPPAVAAPRRDRQANGVVFSGRSDQIAAVKLQMRALLAQMGWNAKQVLVRESADGERVAYMLYGAPGDTNTFVLAQQPQLAIRPEMVGYTDRRGQKKTLSLVSQKEILAAMLQPGRACLFSGVNCRVESLKEQIALRQNIVYWGLRADWVFPEDKVYRYNTADYWQVMTGDDWTLKPGVRLRQAVADAFVGKFSYQIGCTSACRFIFVHGILDFFTQAQPHSAAAARLEQLLDKRRPFLEIAPQVDRNRVVIKDGRLMERHLDVPWNHWVPGDWGWIKNPDEKSSEELGSEGCNIIYAGGGYFVNYYPERPPKTLDQALKRVYGWRFGLEESELNLAADLMNQLRQDPRSGGMLRDVRDFPRVFGTAPARQPGA